ncbi:e869f2c6-9770-4108-a7e7-7fe8e39d6e2b [Sclerotinia trifoliorum]|uniref:E869f2c6-9770-4108-a7e7-7fe8e39d6e2b n=1 Tax=Sclerotinia trifoliorum TaxID=28548 RepID=A0A8H2ZTX8_9HELO|nr:e869f2c6-9770-4108-a7e7-7fe8e39d6e2b [Sclerotinia trifoliorum]
MSTQRRGEDPLNIDVGTNADLPSLAALFMIYFDIKAGYTIGWKRSLSGIELDGVVEYRSLPSGLHTVEEDLIYFTHDNYAGLSAFVNAPADEDSRNARMIAVGIMVPLSYGRLGRSWKHAESLKDIASALILDESKTERLEEFWESHKGEDLGKSKETDSLLDSPSSARFKFRNTPPKSKSHNRNRSASDGAALLPPGHTLSVYHPAWSLPKLLETFGPMIFPIQRAALLRKRILISAHAPVHETCDFVYAISVLSNIPLAVSDLLEPTAPPQRLRPLFSIGVHDIPLLEDDLKALKRRATSEDTVPTDGGDELGCGWIACTTDSILATKTKLYDILITMPPPHASASTAKVWPKVECSPGSVELKATQRDLRRYKALRWGLSRTPHPASPNISNSRRASTSSYLEQFPSPIDLNSPTTALPPRDDPMLDIPDTDSIIEPISWAALAYSGFIWWASAGEQRLHSQEEWEADSTLLSSPHTPNPFFTPLPINQAGTLNAETEMGIIAYFHRLTSQILTTLSDVIDASDSDDEREDDLHHSHHSSSPLLNRGNSLSSSSNGGGDATNEDEEDDGMGCVYISSTDMERMGLDIWSAGDYVFVEEIVKEYFGRRAKIEGRGVDICGVRIC